MNSTTVKYTTSLNKHFGQILLKEDLKAKDIEQKWDKYNEGKDARLYEVAGRNDNVQKARALRYSLGSASGAGGHRSQLHKVSKDLKEYDSFNRIAKEIITGKLRRAAGGECVKLTPVGSATISAGIESKEVNNFSLSELIKSIDTLQGSVKTGSDRDEVISALYEFKNELEGCIVGLYNKGEGVLSGEDNSFLLRVVDLFSSLASNKCIKHDGGGYGKNDLEGLKAIVQEIKQAGNSYPSSNKGQEVSGVKHSNSDKGPKVSGVKPVAPKKSLVAPTRSKIVSIIMDGVQEQPSDSGGNGENHLPPPEYSSLGFDKVPEYEEFIKAMEGASLKKFGDEVIGVFHLIVTHDQTPSLSTAGKPEGEVSETKLLSRGDKQDLVGESPPPPYEEACVAGRAEGIRPQPEGSKEKDLDRIKNLFKNPQVVNKPADILNELLEFIDKYGDDIAFSNCSSSSDKKNYNEDGFKEYINIDTSKDGNKANKPCPSEMLLIGAFAGGGLDCQGVESICRNDNNKLIAVYKGLIKQLIDKKATDPEITTADLSEIQEFVKKLNEGNLTSDDLKSLYSDISVWQPDHGVTGGVSFAGANITYKEEIVEDRKEYYEVLIKFNPKFNVLLEQAIKKEFDSFALVKIKADVENVHKHLRKIDPQTQAVTILRNFARRLRDVHNDGKISLAAKVELQNTFISLYDNLCSGLEGKVNLTGYKNESVPDADISVTMLQLVKDMQPLGWEAQYVLKIQVLIVNYDLNLKPINSRSKEEQYLIQYGNTYRNLVVVEGDKVKLTNLFLACYNFLDGANQKLLPYLDSAVEAATKSAKAAATDNEVKFYKDIQNIDDINVASEDANLSPIINTWQTKYSDQERVLDQTTIDGFKRDNATHVARRLRLEMMKELNSAVGGGDQLIIQEILTQELVLQTITVGEVNEVIEGNPDQLQAIYKGAVNQLIKNKANDTARLTFFDLDKIDVFRIRVTKENTKDEIIALYNEVVGYKSNGDIPRDSEFLAKMRTVKRGALLEEQRAKYKDLIKVNGEFQKAVDGAFNKKVDAHLKLYCADPNITSVVEFRVKDAKGVSDQNMQAKVVYVNLEERKVSYRNEKGNLLTKKLSDIYYLWVEGENNGVEEIKKHLDGRIGDSTYDTAKALFTPESYFSRLEEMRTQEYINQAEKISTDTFNNKVIDEHNVAIGYLRELAQGHSYSFPWLGAIKVGDPAPSAENCLYKNSTGKFMLKWKGNVIPIMDMEVFLKLEKLVSSKKTEDDVVFDMKTIQQLAKQANVELTSLSGTERFLNGYSMLCDYYLACQIYNNAVEEATKNYVTLKAKIDSKQSKVDYELENIILVLDLTNNLSNALQVFKKSYSSVNYKALIDQDMDKKYSTHMMYIIEAMQEQMNEFIGKYCSPLTNDSSSFENTVLKQLGENLDLVKTTLAKQAKKVEKAGKEKTLGELKQNGDVSSKLLKDVYAVQEAVTEQSNEKITIGAGQQELHQHIEKLYKECITMHILLRAADDDFDVSAFPYKTQTVIESRAQDVSRSLMDKNSFGVVRAYDETKTKFRKAAKNLEIVNISDQRESVHLTKNIQTPALSRRTASQANEMPSTLQSLHMGHMNRASSTPIIPRQNEPKESVPEDLLKMEDLLTGKADVKDGSSFPNDPVHILNVLVNNYNDLKAEKFAKAVDAEKLKTVVKFLTDIQVIGYEAFTKIKHDTKTNKYNVVNDVNGVHYRRLTTYLLLATSGAMWLLDALSKPNSADLINSFYDRITLKSFKIYEMADDEFNESKSLDDGVFRVKTKQVDVYWVVVDGQKRKLGLNPDSTLFASGLPKGGIIETRSLQTIFPDLVSDNHKLAELFTTQAERIRLVDVGSAGTDIDESTVLLSRKFQEDANPIWAGLVKCGQIFESASGFDFSDYSSKVKYNDFTPRAENLFGKVREVAGNKMDAFFWKVENESTPSLVFAEYRHLSEAFMLRLSEHYMPMGE